MGKRVDMRGKRFAHKSAKQVSDVDVFLPFQVYFAKNIAKYSPFAWAAVRDAQKVPQNVCGNVFKVFWGLHLNFEGSRRRVWHDC